MPPEEIDSEWAYQDLPQPFPDDPAIQFALGEVVEMRSSFRCWGYLRDAQNPEKFDASYECSGIWTVRDRGYFLDLEGELQLPDATDGCYYFLELENKVRERCWTYEQLLLEAKARSRGLKVACRKDPSTADRTSHDRGHHS
jgi:hypothetical protein